MCVVDTGKITGLAGRAIVGRPDIPGHTTRRRAIDTSIETVFTRAQFVVDAGVVLVAVAKRERHIIRGADVQHAGGDYRGHARTWVRDYGFEVIRRIDNRL